MAADEHCMEYLAKLIGVYYELGDHASLVRAAQELPCRLPCNATGHSSNDCSAQHTCCNYCCDFLDTGCSVVFPLPVWSFGNCL